MTTYAFAYIIDRDDDDREGLIPRRLCGGCSHIDAPESARRGCGEVLERRDAS